MKVTVLIPGVLRTTTDGASQVDLEVADQATLGTALDALADTYPGLDRRLRDERTTLRRYVNFYVNGEECRRLAGPDTPLPAGAEIQILPSVAGG